jgi:hypothetical protein
MASISNDESTPMHAQMERGDIDENDQKEQDEQEEQKEDDIDEEPIEKRGDDDEEEHDVGNEIRQGESNQSADPDNFSSMIKGIHSPYRLGFGLARDDVQLSQEESKFLTLQLREALWECVACFWGVSMNTYLDHIAVSGNDAVLNPQKRPHSDSYATDVEILKQNISDPQLRQFLLWYYACREKNKHRTKKCRRADPVRQILDVSSRSFECVVSYVDRMYKTLERTDAIVQLFNSTLLEKHYAFLSGFRFALKNLLSEERLDDDASCCDLGEELIFVVEQAHKRIRSAILAILHHIDVLQFSPQDDPTLNRSIEIPALVNEKSKQDVNDTETDDNESSDEKATFSSAIESVSSLRKQGAEIDPDFFQTVMQLVQRQRQSESDTSRSSPPAQPQQQQQQQQQQSSARSRISESDCRQQ